MAIITFFSGRLTADPEIKVVGGGSEVCKFSVAVSRYAGKDKEKETDFINCDAWGATGAAIAKFLKKGDQIIVEGGELRSSKKDEKIYWSVNVNKFEFGAKKAREEAAKDGFIKDDDLPF